MTEVPTTIDSSWLVKRTTAREYVCAVFEPDERVPAALRARIETFAERVDRSLAAGEELWAWRRPHGTLGGLAIVREGRIVRSFPVKA